MEKELNEKLVGIENEIKELPERAQRVICWIVKNLNLVTEMCKEEYMTDEEIEKYMEIAKEKEDYSVIALLCVAKEYKNRDDETMTYN